MDPQQQALYGLVDNQALIVREGHICDIVPETQLPVSGDNIHDMQGRLVTLTYRLPHASGVCR